jgi:hypothetical protein
VGIDVVQDLAQCDTEFNFINAEQVFEHIASPLKVLRALNTRLDTNGLLRISVPNGKRFLRRLHRGVWKPSKDPIHPLEHVNCFTHRTLIRLAKEAGLAPISPLRLLRAIGEQSLMGSMSVYGLAARIYSQYLATGIVFHKI